jgi:hypothetical protein
VPNNQKNFGKFFRNLGISTRFGVPYIIEGDGTPATIMIYDAAANNIPGGINGSLHEKPGSEVPAG